jgi:adenine-specific DNA-methyltransferase
MADNGTFKTQGIKYAGSKLKILPYIMQMVGSLNQVKNVLDGFSGTTRVSQALAQSGYRVTANDLSDWSEVLGNCYLKATKPDVFYQEILDELNSLQGYNGWFTAHYANPDELEKMPFQRKNLRKVDAIRDHIENLNLGWEDKCVILTSLMLALDKVDNTLGHFSSYLSEWSARSYQQLNLQLPMRFELKDEHEVCREDVMTLTKERTFDLVYFDPPYGSNNQKMPSSRVRYQSYYHFWTTLIKHDSPELFGKVNRRADSRDGKAVTIFEEYKRNNENRYIALDALRKLIEQTNAHYIMLSYSSGGKATKEELHDILSSSGKLLQVMEIDYRKNIMSQMRWTNEWINSDGKYREYLFLMEK